MKKYKMTLFLLLIGMSVALTNCKTGDKKITEVQKQQHFSELKALVESGSFRVDVDVVMPFNTAATTEVLNQITPYMNGSSVGRINVAGAGHYLEVNDNMAKASMPYFGQQQQGGQNYGKADIGVDIDGAFTEYEVSYNEKKRNARIEFNINDSNNQSENYNVIITAWSNLRADITVVSAQRTTIRYYGNLGAVDESM